MATSSLHNTLQCANGFLSEIRSILPFIAPEKQRNRTRPSVTSNRRANVVDFNRPIQFREICLHQIGNRFCIVIAGRIADVTLAIIIQPISGMRLHFLHNLRDNFFLAPNFITWDQTAQVVHIQQRANVQHRAEPTRRLGHAPASDVKREIRREKPVVHLQPVEIGPIRQFVDSKTEIPQIS